MKDPNHVFLRPYARLIAKGSPDFGYVRYQLATLRGRDPRTLSAISIRRKKPFAPAEYIPADLTIYPGVSLSRPHSNDFDGPGRLHHISVREANNGGIQVYSHILTPHQAIRPTIRRRLHPITELGGLIHLGQVLAKDWQAFDPCGIAYTTVSPKLFAARQRMGSMGNYPPVRNHSLHEIPLDYKLAKVPNYLWQGYFLSQRKLTKEDFRDIIWFFGHNVNSQTRAIRSLPAYDGPVHGLLATLPLDFEARRTEPYRFLHTVTIVMPGNLGPPTGLVGFPNFLPILSRDFQANPSGYETYAKTLGPQRSRRRHV